MRGEAAFGVLVERLAKEMGLEVWEARLVPGGPGRRAIVQVDRPGGVTLGELEALSKRLSSALDTDPPLKGPYALDVASPGPERRLRGPDDIERYLGERVRVVLSRPVGGQRNVTGRTEAAEADAVVLREDDGAVRRIPWSEIKRVNLRP